MTIPKTKTITKNLFHLDCDTKVLISRDNGPELLLPEKRSQKFATMSASGWNLENYPQLPLHFPLVTADLVILNS